MLLTLSLMMWQILHLRYVLENPDRDRIPSISNEMERIPFHKLEMKHLMCPSFDKKNDLTFNTIAFQLHEIEMKHLSSNDNSIGCESRLIKQRL
jgi:hypothetical protein